MSTFTKAENRIVRELIPKAVEKEFDIAIHEVEGLLNKWKNKEADSRTSYHAMFDLLRDHRKHLYMRYDAIKNSFFPDLIVQLLRGWTDHGRRCRWLLR